MRRYQFTFYGETPRFCCTLSDGWVFRLARGSHFFYEDCYDLLTGWTLGLHMCLVGGYMNKQWTPMYLLINRFTRERKGLTVVHTYFDTFTCDTHLSDIPFGFLEKWKTNFWCIVNSFATCNTMGGQLTCVKEYAHIGAQYKFEYSRKRRKYGPNHCAVLVCSDYLEIV